jgi:hypothetical protein
MQVMIVFATQVPVERQSGALLHLILLSTDSVVPGKPQFENTK